MPDWGPLLVLHTLYSIHHRVKLSGKHSLFLVTGEDLVQELMNVYRCMMKEKKMYKYFFFYKRAKEEERRKKEEEKRMKEEKDVRWIQIQAK